MSRLMPALWCGTLIVAYLAGGSTGPSGFAAAQGAAGGTQAATVQPAPPAGALPPGEHSKIQLAPDQGEPQLFSGEDLRKAHVELQTRSKTGQPANAGSLMKPLVTRTHSYMKRTGIAGERVM